jgi:hypothetical protein
MPFSLSSYLLGVGTVVGALAFGFGGGVLLTKTAMKDSPMAETRVERIKRADSPSTPQQPVEAKATPAPAEPPPGSAPPVQASTEPPKPVAEALQPAEPAKAAASVPPTEPAAAAAPIPQTEPAKPADQSIKSAEQREAELRKAEARKIERQKRYAERKARAMAEARARQRQWQEQAEPSGADVVFERSSRPALAFEREEPRFKPFDIPLFGRSGGRDD